MLLCTNAVCALFYEMLKVSLITTRPYNGVDVAIQAAHVALTIVYNAFPVYSYFSTSICREVAGLLEVGDVGFSEHPPGAYYTPGHDVGMTRLPS